MDAGLPNWNDLLLKVLKTYMGTEQDGQTFSKEGLKESFPSSSLILGKYLKILLGDDFEAIIKQCLYEDINKQLDAKTEESRLIKALEELIRPKRKKGSVESVITFNFDLILEDCLNKNGIQYKPIYEEGMRIDVNQTPIFHVHGYLPRFSEIENPNLVFSEEAYHTEFIDI